MKPITILFAIVSEGEEEVAFLREDDPSYLFYDDARREFLEKDFTSDILFRIGMESDLRMAGYLARRITGDESIEIDEVDTESVVENIGHSVRLDALARDRKGTLYDFEMQGYREEGGGRDGKEDEDVRRFPHHLIHMQGQIVLGDSGSCDDSVPYGRPVREGKAIIHL